MWRSAHFASPDHDRVVEKSTLLEVEDQGRDGLIGNHRILCIDRGTFGSQQSRCIGCRKKRTRKIFAATVGYPVIVQQDVTGQILVLRSKSIVYPRSETWCLPCDSAGMQQQVPQPRLRPDS